MVFHTFLGWYTAKEYKNYRQGMLNRVPSTMNGKSNGGFDAEGKHNDLVPADLEEDIISAEEFDYPKASRLNKWVNIVFIVVLGAFNVMYWTVALAVYFS